MLSVGINPKRVSISDEGLVYNDTYANFLLHAIGYFTALPVDCLQYYREGSPKTLEYKVIDVAGQASQVVADDSLILEIDNVLANLAVIISLQLDENTPEATLGLLEFPATNLVQYGDSLDFNLLYNKDLEALYTLPISVINPQLYANEWVVNVDNVIEPLSIMFTQIGTWTLNLVGIVYSIEVK